MGTFLQKLFRLSVFFFVNSRNTSQPLAPVSQTGSPGGGLDFGEQPQVGLAREIEEEMGLAVTKVSGQPLYTWPAYFENRRGMDWYYSMVLVYVIEIDHLDFTPTEECEEIGFFTKEELQELDLYHQSAPLRGHFNLTDFE